MGHTIADQTLRIWIMGSWRREKTKDLRLNNEYQERKDTNTAPI